MPANTDEREKSVECGTYHLQATPKFFPFLRLPAEIRNQIYRLSLLRENVSTDVLKVRPWETASGAAQPGEVTVGAIRCRYHRVYTIEFQISILRTNWQIYHEASSIFNLENFWTIVRVNKAGFGKEMKDRGFPIMTADDLWCRFRFPVMKVTVRFPTLHCWGQCDAFLIATFHLKQLMRVLWTAVGSSEIEVMIQVQPPLTKNSPSERQLLVPFFRLVGIRKVIVSGVSDQGNIAKLTSAITTGIDIDRVHIGLMRSLCFLQGCVKEQRWGDAIAHTERHTTLLADCRTVFGNRIFGIEPGLNVNKAIARRSIAVEIFIAAALANAEVSLHQQIYTNAIRFATRALTLFHSELVYYPAIAATLNVLVPPRQFMLLPITGTTASLNEFLCRILCVRAGAYIGTQKAGCAVRDINEARELMPTSSMLASVSEDWQARFGSVASSALLAPPAATESSSGIA
ncbi:hypothetical protein MMC29_002558 [Sticta canariensis]|nr:hypothetical protein [Sticta canariensis]